MSILLLETQINAPVQRVFDLSRSIDLHKISMAHSDEKAVEGKTEGLLELNETVTWKAKHLGLYQYLTVKMTALEGPFYFTDAMTKGAFAFMEHTHLFFKEAGGTNMVDRFEFRSPMGWFGKLFDFFFLKKYMTKVLQERNKAIKAIAESEDWKKLLAV